MLLHRVHGGNVPRLSGRRWLDLSTGINPWAYPTGKIPSTAWRRLPQDEAVDTLVQAAEAYYNLPAGARVIPCSGAQSAIQILPYLFPPTSVAILGPTYSEHEYCWKRGRHAVTILDTLATPLDSYKILIVTNPNNPNGERLSPETLAAILRHLSARDGTLIVDEAFADGDAISMIPYSASDHLIILRSFGKFFGLAGLRLGFTISGASLASRIEDAFGPWAVNGPALTIGAMALQDQGWIARTHQTLRSAQKALKTLLSGYPFLRLIGSTSLFCLVETENAADLFAHHLRHRIFLRSFSYAPSWLRIGLPKTRNDSAKLTHVLTTYQQL